MFLFCSRLFLGVLVIRVMGAGRFQSHPVPSETRSPVPAMGVRAVPAPLADGDGRHPCHGLSSVRPSLSLLGVCGGR